MRIGIDAGALCSTANGISRSVRELALQLQKFDRVNDYYLYSRRDFDFPLENPRWHKCLHPRVPYLLGNLYLRNGRTGRAGVGGLDVFWTPRTFSFPFGLSPAVGRLATVYDLAWLYYPETMETRNRLGHQLFAKRGIEHAHRIISISESTRRDLIDRLGVPPEKILVVHLGVADRFAPRAPIESARIIADKYGTSTDYICTVGTIEPRKNIVSLIKAVRILRDRGQLRHQLLVAGSSGWKNSDVYATVERCGLTEREVRFLGRVPEEDLPELYSGASVFVFPSIYEGFGLPLVEAMACGTPVVASNTSSIPEVVHDAGILVRPDRPEEFADAIRRVVRDEALRFELVRKGVRRARAFSWDVAARRVLSALNTVAAARDGRITAGGS
ncbi:MAG TPA: glycosyltransferase family 1 protein [Candidatus Eisenbacteria bacterium]|nr:glycosyltransferase family 1 protein [Candidatus Eisenbacteria bacterium]